jgi:hypothetical protein
VRLCESSETPKEAFRELTRVQPVSDPVFSAATDGCASSTGPGASRL